MLEILVRWRQVARRVISPFSGVQSLLAKLLALAAAAGLGYVVITHKAVLAWVNAGHTHQAFAAMAMLAAFALWALYRLQKEVDDKTKVRLLEPRVIVDFRHDFGDLKDAIRIDIRWRLRHEGQLATVMSFPSMELFERGPWRRWRLVPASFHRYAWRCPDLKQPMDFVEVAAPTMAWVEFWVHVTAPAGAGAFVGKELKLRTTTDVAGQSLLINNTPLPVPKLPPAPPQADPPLPKASG